jgi:hypothetical protein
MTGVVEGLSEGILKEGDKKKIITMERTIVHIE